MSFMQAYIEYMQEYACIKLKPQSIRSVDSRFRSYIIPFFKNYMIEDITPLLYLKWQKQIEEKGFGYNYNKALHYTMVGLFNYLITFHGKRINIPVQVGNFKKNKPQKKTSYWTLSEYNKFTSFIDDDMYRTLFDLLFFTGCRLGEALALTFDDLNNNILSINKTISKESINGSRIITSPKTASSIRDIALDSLLTRDLMSLKNIYKTMYKLDSNEMYIFGGLTPLSPTTIERKKNKWCMLANVKQIRLHDFRHSHATLLYSNNLPITTISDRLGHSDYSMTLNVYIHSGKEQEKRVINTLNSLRLN